MSSARQAVWAKIRRVVRTILHDLFGEDELSASEANPAPLPAEAIQLGPIQAQLDALVPQVAGLEARQRQSEAERARLEAERRALEGEIDRALLGGENETARALTMRKLDLARQEEVLAQRCQEQAQTAAQARAVLERMQKRWAEARRQLADLSVRAQDAQALEALSAVRRDLEAILASLDHPEAKK